MGFFKEEKSPRKSLIHLTPRWIKTLFFLITMLASLLLFSTSIILIIADALLPAALFSVSLSPSFLTLQTISSSLQNYDFRNSLIDIPLVSIARSAVILFVYSFCDGPKLSRGPYLWIVTICSTMSLVFVSFKASYVFVISNYDDSSGGVYVHAMFISSVALAIGHVLVAYRTCCRERRKLLVYRIDIEAVSACKNGFPRYQKIKLQETRTK